jgi:hypothetical protein
MSLIVTLPLPPSSNNLYPTVVRGKRAFRVKSGAYKNWIEVAGFGDWPGPYPPRTKWSLYIDLGKMPHTRDVDNCAKAVIDLLARRCGLSDKWLDHLSIFRSGVDRKGQCEVELITGGWVE